MHTVNRHRADAPLLASGPVKSPLPLSRTPAAPAADRIAIREIRMPDAGRPFSPKRTWQVQPGETFAAGGALGELTFAPPPTATFAAGVISLFNVSVNRQQQTYPVTAPEAGVLTWLAPEAEVIPTGAAVAKYIPLAAWQAYEGLLAEHDRQFQEQTAAQQQAGAPAPLEGLASKLDALIARVNSISARAIRADKSAMIPLLVRQLDSFIRTACPVGTEELAPLYHYFCLIQSVDERLHTLDARYAVITRDPSLTPPETQELIWSWLENKQSVIRQVTGELTGTADGDEE